jgi:ribonuclease P protein component
MECKPAVPERTAGSAPRFGFTVTKKLGNAVVRNRIRRRLKAALSLAIPGRAHPGFDYVVVARPAAASQPFPDMVKELELAFARVHHPRGARGAGPARVASDRAKPARGP